MFFRKGENRHLYGLMERIESIDCNSGMEKTKVKILTAGWRGVKVSIVTVVYSKTINEILTAGWREVKVSIVSAWWRGEKQRL